MAEITAQKYEGGSGFSVFLWEGLSDEDTCIPLKVQGNSGITLAVQLTGTFGGTVTFEGSINGQTWVTLQTLDNEDATASAVGAFGIREGFLYIRPSAGSGVSDVDVFLLVRGS
jgi:hypothetical protein